MYTLARKRKILAAAGHTAAAYQARILADGASNYWPLDDPSGLVAVDRAGGANGTISGGVTLNQDGVGGGKCMTFDGTTGRIISIANVSLIPPFTVEWWLKLTNLANTTHGLGGSQFPNAGEDTFNFTQNILVGSQFDLVGFVTYANAASPNTGYQTSPLPVSEQWQHVVWKFPGGTVIELYLNGVLIPTVPSQLVRVQVGTTLRPFHIGYATTHGNYYLGSMQDIAIYPRALTPAEISAHYSLRT